jgi:hypothetical protein
MAAMPSATTRRSEHPPQRLRGFCQLRIGNARRVAEGDPFLRDVALRGDVAALRQRHQMGGRVRNVAAGEEEADPPHAVGSLPDGHQAPAEMQDGGRQDRRQVLEVRDMRPRDDLQMPGADRVDVEEGDDLGFLVMGSCSGNGGGGEEKPRPSPASSLLLPKAGEIRGGHRRCPGVLRLSAASS